MNATIRTGAFATKGGSVLLDELKSGRRVDEVSLGTWGELARALNVRLDANQCASRLRGERLRFDTLSDEFASIERIREVLREERAPSPRQTRASRRRPEPEDAKSTVSTNVGSVFSKNTFVRSINARRPDYAPPPP